MGGHRCGVRVRWMVRPARRRKTVTSRQCRDHRRIDHAVPQVQCLRPQAALAVMKISTRPPTFSAPVQRRVLIVDDHPIVRQGLRRMIEPEPDLVVCGEVQTEREARAAIRALAPDVVIVDISLAQGDGLELVRDVHAQRPELPMLVLSMHDELIYAERLLAAGASGYIMKQAASDELLLALRQVLAGGQYLSESLAGNLGRSDAAVGGGGVGSADPIDRLSNRELQVLSLIGRGLSSREAAE